MFWKSLKILLLLLLQLAKCKVTSHTNISLLKQKNEDWRLNHIHSFIFHFQHHTFNEYHFFLITATTIAPRYTFPSSPLTSSHFSFNKFSVSETGFSLSAKETSPQLFLVNNLFWPSKSPANSQKWQFEYT